MFSSVVKRIDSGAQIFAGHEVKPNSKQDLLIFPDFLFTRYKAFVPALITVATDSVLGSIM